MRRLMAAYTNASPLAHIVSHSLCSSSCCGRSTKTCVLLPTASAAPESLRGAIASSNLPLRPLWPTLEPKPSAPLRERTFAGVQRAAHSIPRSSPPSPCLCLRHGSQRPPTGERGEEIAHPLCAVAS